MKKYVRAGRKINRGRAGNFFALLFLLLLAAFMALPLVFVVNNAFKPLDELFVYPPKFFVRHPTTENFADMLRIMSQSWVPFTRYVFNTVFITVAGTCGQLFLASMAAFALSKHDFPGKNIMFSAVVLSLMFTPAVTSIPNYIIMARTGLLDSYLAILLPSLQSTLGLYLMKQFMDGIPNTILEAARIDGAGEIRIYWSIGMPMVKPAWLTLIILMIQSLWNMVSPYIYSEELKTLPQAMGQVVAGGIARTGAASAIALVMMIVPLMTFILSQSSVIETMNASGIKE